MAYRLESCRSVTTNPCRSYAGEKALSTVTNQLLEAASRYAVLGYPVFPCVPGDKNPLTQHGFLDASMDPGQIERWWHARPNSNIGISTQGLIVIDFDGPQNSWLADDRERMLQLSVAPMAITPRGGRHRVFRQPAGKNWRCTEKRLAPDVDTRGNGGYIVAPPSVMSNGSAYRWAPGGELNDTPENLPEPPAWLIEQLDQLAIRSPGVSSVVTNSTGPNQIPEGQRNGTLARLGGSMRRVGMSEVEILAALIQANNDRCTPPLPQNEVERIAASVARYEPDTISVALVEDHYGQMSVAAESAPESSDPGCIPETLLRIPGFVSELMDYCLATAPYPNSVMAFCGALSLQAFLAGRKVRDSADIRSNLYLLGLAHSAAGKDHPRKINTRVLHEIGMESSLGDRFASGEGIQDALFLSPSMLFQTDEFDGMLQSIARDKDARYESIIGTLLSMYSASNSVFPMRRKAGKEYPGAIDQPCLVIFGTAIPTHYYEALSERLLTNGFFARTITLESGPRGAGQEPRILELPPRVLQSARHWRYCHTGSGNLDNLHPNPAVVPYTTDAARLLAAARGEAEGEYTRAESRGDAVGTTVWGRVDEQSRKLALLYAISENHAAPSIGVEAARWSTQFMFHQTRRMLYMAQCHAAANPFHCCCLRLLRKLREAPGQTLSHSTLLKKMKLDAKTFQQIIDTLHQQGDIESSQSLTHGRTGVLYRLTTGG